MLKLVLSNQDAGDFSWIPFLGWCPSLFITFDSSSEWCLQHTHTIVEYNLCVLLISMFIVPFLKDMLSKPLKSPFNIYSQSNWFYSSSLDALGNFTIIFSNCGLWLWLSSLPSYRPKTGCSVFSSILPKTFHFISFWEIITEKIFFYISDNLGTCVSRRITSVHLTL